MKEKAMIFFVTSQMFLNTEEQFCAEFNLFWEQALLGDVISLLTLPLHLIPHSHGQKAKGELEITVGKDKQDEKTKICLSESWQMKKSIEKLYNP